MAAPGQQPAGVEILYLLGVCLLDACKNRNVLRSPAMRALDCNLKAIEQAALPHAWMAAAEPWRCAMCHEPCSQNSLKKVMVSE